MLAEETKGPNTMSTITIARTAQGWHAVFKGGNMPQGVALPLPLTSAASADAVRFDLRSRFPDAAIVTKGRASEIPHSWTIGNSHSGARS
jgi:hypothetical protein